MREFYSWIPKELIARFVNGCPDCQRKGKAANASERASANASGSASENATTTPTSAAVA